MNVPPRPKNETSWGPPTSGFAVRSETEGRRVATLSCLPRQTLVSAPVGRSSASIREGPDNWSGPFRAPFPRFGHVQRPFGPDGHATWVLEPPHDDRHPGACGRLLRLDDQCRNAATAIRLKSLPICSCALRVEVLARPGRDPLAPSGGIHRRNAQRDYTSLSNRFQVDHEGRCRSDGVAPGVEPWRR